MSFSVLNRAAAGVLVALAMALVFLPGVLYGMFGLEVNPLGGFVSRRTAMFMLGAAVLLWLTARSADAQTRRAVAVSMVVTFGGLALMGLGEFLRGFAGPGIFVAIVTETFFTFGYLRLLLRDGV